MNLLIAVFIFIESVWLNLFAAHNNRIKQYKWMHRELPHVWKTIRVVGSINMFAI